MEQFRLAALRVNAGMTQEELASRVGLTARTIGTYERDVERFGEVRYLTLKKIASALGCKVDDIFLG